MITWLLKQEEEGAMVGKGDVVMEKGAGKMRSLITA